MLFLLNDPGEGGETSGLLTVLNDDPTSRAQRKAIAASRLDRSVGLWWNGIPWPTARADRNKHLPAGADALADLLGKLPQLRAVVTLGEFADKTYQRLSNIEHLAHIRACHPIAWSKERPTSAEIQAA